MVLQYKKLTGKRTGYLHRNETLCQLREGVIKYKKLLNQYKYKRASSYPTRRAFVKGGFGSFQS